MGLAEGVIDDTCLVLELRHYLEFILEKELCDFFNLAKKVISISDFTSPKCVNFLQEVLPKRYQH